MFKHENPKKEKPKQIGEKMEIVAQCMKCKEKKTMVDPKKQTTKNGRTMYKGKCPDCGTTMCRFVSDKK